MSKKWLLSEIAIWKRCFQIQGARHLSKFKKTTKFTKMSLENLNSNQFEFVSTLKQDSCSLFDNLFKKIGSNTVDRNGI